MQDLSALSKGWPSFGASMAAGSTVDNNDPWGKAPGSESEQTELAAQGVDVQGHASPDLSYTPDKADPDTSTGSRFSTSYSPSAPEWKTVKLWNPDGTERAGARKSLATCASLAPAPR